MQTLDLQTLYVLLLWSGLFLIGLWHLFSADLTEAIFKNSKNVRLAGIGLIVLALPCLALPRPYFILVGLVLLLSGLLRAVFPEFNIRIEKKTFSRRGHGLVIMVAAVLGFAAYQWNWLAH